MQTLLLSFVDGWAGRCQVTWCRRGHVTRSRSIDTACLRAASAAVVAVTMAAGDATLHSWLPLPVTSETAVLATVSNVDPFNLTLMRTL